MKPPKVYLPILALLLSSLLLDACSFSVEIMNTTNYSSIPSTPTLDLPLDPTPAPSLTPAPVEDLPSPTPTLISLREGTVSMLEIFMHLQQEQAVRGLAFTPDGTVLASAGGDAGDFGIHLWDVINNQSLGTLDGHTGIVWDVAFSPDGSTVATATCIMVVKFDCSEGGIWLWDLPTGRLLRKLGGFPSLVESVAFTADGSNLVAGSRDGTLRFYPTSDYVSLFQFDSPGGISALALSPDGGLLATGNSNGEVFVWKNVYRP